MSSVLEVVGSRAANWCAAPKGTPSRALKLRLDRTSGHDNHPRSTFRKLSVPGLSSLGTSPPVTLSAWTRTFTTSTRCEHGHVQESDRAVQKLQPDELELLRRVMQQRREMKYNRHQRTETSLPLSTSCEASVPSKDPDVLPSSDHQEAPEIPGTQLQKVFKTDTRIWRYIRILTSPSVEKNELQVTFEMLKLLPPTTFSELLRAVDPISGAGWHMDSMGGLHISSSMRIFTTLGRGLGFWGRRKIYRDLLARVLLLIEMRLQAGLVLTSSDWKVVLRCSGAASHMQATKKVWSLMEGAGALEARDATTYTEFVRARFLTELSYSQFDMSRFRMRALNLGRHKQHVEFLKTQLRKLRRIRLNQYPGEIRNLRSAHNSEEEEVAEHLSRVLANPGPIRRIWGKILADQYTLDEELLCAVIIAQGRSGSLKFIEEFILWRIWHIKVRKDHETGQWMVEGGTTEYGRDSPMHPTTRLMEAVVEAYCCNSELSRAVKIVDFLSQRYGIQTPERIWFSILEWTYIASSSDASWEWKIAKRPGKIVPPSAVSLVWETMTSEPYNVQPKFHQYDILIKSLIARGRLKEALKYMLQLEPYYRSMLPALEESFYAFIEAERLGVPNRSTTAVPPETEALPSREHIDMAQTENRWHLANARKDAVLHAFRTWCGLLLRKTRRYHRTDTDFRTRLVPQIMAAFRPLLPRKVVYGIPTGTVEIQNAETVRRMVLKKKTYRRPMMARPDMLHPSDIDNVRQKLQQGNLPEDTVTVLEPAYRPLHYDFAWRKPSAKAIERQFT